MLDYWMKVRDSETRLYDFAVFLADDDAQALTIARELRPDGDCELRQNGRVLRTGSAHGGGGHVQAKPRSPTDIGAASTFRLAR